VRPLAVTSGWVAAGAGRLRIEALAIFESVIAATAAWVLDVNLLHHSL